MLHGIYVSRIAAGLAPKKRGGSGSIPGSGYFPSLSTLLVPARQHHRVDHVDHSVRRLNVRLHHLRTGNPHSAIHHGDLRHCAIHRLRLAKLHHIARHHLPRHHVVRQDRRQLLPVREQGFHSPCGQLRERRVGRCKDSEWAFASQHRFQSGQRQYTDLDVERLRLLRRATEGGRPIGRVADLPVEELKGLVEEDEGARRRTERSRLTALEGAAAGAVDRALEAIRAMNGERLERELFRSAVQVGRGVFLEQVAAPLLKQVGEAWHAGDLGVAQEHLVTATLHRAVAWLVGATSGSERNVVVVATPPGQRHEMGALLSAAVAVDEGWRVLYLGADLPGEEIGWAAVEGGATVIALSVVYPEEDEGVVAALRAVRSSVPPEIALVVGGAAAGSYRGVIRELGGEHVEDFGSFRFFLRDRAVGSASSGS